MAERAPVVPMAEVATLDELLPYLMNRVVSRLNQNLAERLRRRRLTFAHWRVLAVLYVRDGLAVGELAELTVIPQSTLSRLLERMERAGLLDRRSSERDSRRVEAWLTTRGQTIYREILPIALTLHHDSVRGFTAQEVAALTAAVRRMLGNLGIGALQD